ncbi:MAG TPA: alpha/beta fold hydrolase [Thiobacillus sp.]|nr:alpha/beta fold hydrolase [Thiobacillus sp.]
MQFKTFALIICYSLASIFFTASYGRADGDCRYDPRPAISFVEIQSLDLQTQQPLTVKGKLNVPVKRHKQEKCSLSRHGLPAVVILHGSAGIDSRGDFYARALNAEGIATLEIDMWEARGVVGLTNRPSHPILTYPDAFAALAFLSSYPGIDPGRIGVMGFSWGGVITMASATQIFATQFGGGLRFKAHVAHYPVCYAFNNPYIPYSEFGGNASNPLTGAPILIQIGDNDDYDEGTAPCIALKAALPAGEQRLVEVVSYEGAYHAWDRLQVPVIAEDPFAHRGAGGTVEIKPSVDQAYQSEEKAVRFFLKNL